MKAVENKVQLARILYKSLHRFIFAVLVAGFALVGGPVPLAHAATFTVDSTDDAVDASPGDGVCETATPDQCTLRAAIMEANALAGADAIDLPAGTYILSIAGTGEDAAFTGDLDITDDLTITGDGQATTIIDGGALDRVFHIDPNAAGIMVEITGLTIDGGFVGSGAGLLNEATLTLNSTTVSGNSSSGKGGGIFNKGTLELHTSTIRDNSSPGSGGGIFNEGTLELYASTISDNSSSGSGGGISNFFGGTVTLNGSTVSGNSSFFDGGGLLNEGSVVLNSSTVSGNSTSSFGDGGGINADRGTVVLNSSTVSGNSSGSGGGIFKDFGGSVSLSNSTVSGNTATAGGGIFIFGHIGTLTLNNSTVSDNTATAGGGIFNDFSTATLKNTIVANNTSGDCSGTITSAGHNLIEDTSGCTIVGDTTGNITGSDPLLGPLADNGGPTLTHALLPGSPAIDAVPGADCTLATDQRGVARPQGPACDIGAFELEVIQVVQVTIDIKPGNDPNSINCNVESQIVTVAILTTDTFDATTVNHTTVTFEGASETHVDKKTSEPRRHEEDVDGDGDIDLVFHFRLGDTGLTCASIEGTLTGETFDGQTIEGTDAVRMIDRGGGQP